MPRHIRIQQTSRNRALKLRLPVQMHWNRGDPNLPACWPIGREPQRSQRPVKLAQVRRDQIAMDRRRPFQRIYSKRTLHLNTASRSQCRQIAEHPPLRGDCRRSRRRLRSAVRRRVHRPPPTCRWRSPSHRPHTPSTARVPGRGRRGQIQDPLITSQAATAHHGCVKRRYREPARGYSPSPPAQSLAREGSGSSWRPPQPPLFASARSVSVLARVRLCLPVPLRSCHHLGQYAPAAQ